MSYVLTVIRPPENGAAYGKAIAFPPLTIPGSIHRRVVDVLAHTYVVPVKDAVAFADVLLRELPLAERVHAGTGVTFRIDPADNAPHPCPCCGRLVEVKEHAYAAADDAVCTGCYTWDSNVEGCLPANTAHPQGS